MMTERERALRQQLHLTYDRLERAVAQLEKSHRKCSLIIAKKEYPDDELESFDALTARFARASDILTHKVLPLIDMIEFEPAGSFLDTINRAEKRGLIPSAFVLKEIRELRNEIAHEYSLRDLEELFGDVIRLTPYLIDAASLVRAFIESLSDENSDDE